MKYLFSVGSTHCTKDTPSQNLTFCGNCVPICGVLWQKPREFFSIYFVPTRYNYHYYIILFLPLALKPSRGFALSTILRDASFLTANYLHPYTSSLSRSVPISSVHLLHSDNIFARLKKPHSLYVAYSSSSLSFNRL